MSNPEIIVLIPESTRKLKDGVPGLEGVDEFAGTLPPDIRSKLRALRDQVGAGSPKGSIATGHDLPAYRRFDGNMYRSIPQDAWENRSLKVEVLIASGLRGMLVSRDTVPAYKHSMAEPMAPFGKLNRWWHDQGLPEILAAYLEAAKPQVVVDLLSLEYRKAVSGFADHLRGISVMPVDFPGMGRGSQPLRGERIEKILRTGRP